MADAWLPKEEYIALRKEVQGATAELARLELACVLAVAALFAWLVRGAGDFVGYQGLVWGVPILVPAYGGLKAWAVHARMARLRSYLTRLEGSASPGEERWLGYLARTRSRARSTVALAAWVLLLVFTLAGSALGFMDFREQCPGPLRNACIQDVDSEESTQGA